MMLKQYTVDAFTDNVFHGNPAAVCVLDQWLPVETMMNIADENHLSETAFTVKDDSGYHLRWFTPGGEIDLCGHATLATAFVLLSFFEQDAKQIVFSTLSGEVSVTKHSDVYEMDLPSYKLKQIPVTDEIEKALGSRPLEAWMGRDLVCVLPSEDSVRTYIPDLARIQELPGLLFHMTAVAKDVDCVIRSFAPKLSIAEDPVCGSGLCHVVPLWSKKLAKLSLVAYQASKRGGTIYCRMNGGRVALAGKAVLFAKSEIFL